MKDNRFIFLEPVERVPFEPHVIRDRTCLVKAANGLQCAFGRLQRVKARGTKLQLLDVILVLQELHANVGHWNIILRVVLDLPDVAGSDRVEHQFSIEITSHPAGGGFDKTSIPY
jgi:hypothetical protein